MNKELIKKLTVYQNKIKDRLSSEVPEKHKNHPESLKRFLMNELDAVTKKIESLKLEGPVK